MKAMLQSVPMVHMQVQVPNRDAAAVTQHIASQGLLHLIDIAHGRILAADASPPGTHEQLAAFRDLAHRVRRTAERLGVLLPEPAGALPGYAIGDFETERRQLDAALRPIEVRAEAAWRRRADAADLATRTRAGLAHSERLARAAIDVERLAHARFCTFAFGVMPAEELATLASVLAPAPFAILPLESASGPILTLAAVPAGVRDRLESALRVVSFERVALDVPHHARPDEARRALAEADRQAVEATQQLQTIRDETREALIDLSQRAELGTLLLQAQTHFAAAGRFVVISGWIPEADAARMRHAIAAVTNERAIVDVQKPEDLPEASVNALRVPILHRNPLLLRPFQSLIQMYGVPAYGEIQPTAFFAISFLLMFGVMFGDVGQGLVLMSAGYCLWRYLPRYLDYGVLLMECGAASVVFGFLYGSLFGLEGVLPVLWMEPIHDMPRFMATAVGFGVVLVSLGLVLNIVNSWRSGDRASALLGPRGVFGAFVYWIGLALIVRAFLPSGMTVPMWLLTAMTAVPIVLLVLKAPIVKWVERGHPARGARPHAPRWLMALEGSVELVDSLFSFFANTISFVRIAAFAAVHAGIFIAMFALADTLSQLRFGQPLAAAALVAGNVVMIFLEGLTVSVQVLRLEYYEFFGKFFKGGGELYRPLMLRKGGL
jgi:V/A-type H+-transporting ATPase subunit I